MREKIIKKASSSLVAAIAILLLLIFIAAMKRPLEKKQYRLLSIGDSYTIGEKVLPEQNFPNQAIAILRKKGFDFAAPKIVARTGWTTDELASGIKKTRLDKYFDFVTLLIGVNNQYRGREVMDYIPEFEALLKQALQYAGNNPKKVIVLSIPDWSVTPYAQAENREQIAGKINEYNRVNRQLADKYQVHYIDITPGTREAIHHPELLAEDGLHPSGIEYSRWAKKLAAVIQSEL